MRAQQWGNPDKKGQTVNPTAPEKMKVAGDK